eukprot:gene139-2355_t
MWVYAALACSYGATLVAADTSGQSEYERACEAIIAHAQRASALYNHGREDEAQEEVENAWFAFNAAKKTAPNEVQAYVSMAQFMLNTNHFDEAEDLWAQAVQLVAEDEELQRTVPHLEQLCRARLSLTRYGRCSLARDRAYQEGQGNITEAIGWAECQLQEYPDSPVLHYEIGTLHVMNSASDSGGPAAARAHYLAAQNASMVPWSLFSKVHGESYKAGLGKLNTESFVLSAADNFDGHYKLAEPSPPADGLEGGLLSPATVYVPGTGRKLDPDDFDKRIVQPSAFTTPNAKLFSTSSPAGLYGHDAVLVTIKDLSEEQNVFHQFAALNSGRLQVNLADNLPMFDSWAGPNQENRYDVHKPYPADPGYAPPTIGRAAILAGFSAEWYSCLGYWLFGYL